MLVDRHRLRRRLREIARSGDRTDRALEVLREQISKSVATAEARRAALPIPDFPADLPITERLDEVRELISNHQRIKN